MSLVFNNKATSKQVEWLKKLDYVGQGVYAPENLTKVEATEILKELFEQQNELDVDGYSFADYYNNKKEE